MPSKRPEQVELFLSLHGLWEGIIQLPRPPPPPFDIETIEPIEPPWHAIKEWIPADEPDLDWFNRPRNPSDRDPDWFDQTPAWNAPGIHLEDKTPAFWFLNTPGKQPAEPPKAAAKRNLGKADREGRFNGNESPSKISQSRKPAARNRNFSR